MRAGLIVFNTVFSLTVLLALGCASSGASASGKKKKPIKFFRVHLETRHDIPERSMAAEVGRSSPMRFMSEKLPILNETHVAESSLIPETGGFEVRIKFTSVGSMLLQNYTSAAVGKHLLLMTEIDGEVRWLAAPLIQRRIDDGILLFVPDASKEEMGRLVDGLNSAVRKKRQRWLEQD